VRWRELVESPEMQLRYPGEEERYVRGDDEGAGTGFDSMYPHAYAERWFRTADKPRQVLRWFDEHLVDAGWRMAGTHRVGRARTHHYGRKSEGRIGVTVFGGDVRVSYQVDGRWADGSSEPRPQ
jgi:hypothetical protein